jgi:hypothetical protein
MCSIKNTLLNNSYNINKVIKHPATQKTKYRNWFTALKNKFGHFCIQRKRNKKDHKTGQGYGNKSNIPDPEHNTKYIKISLTNRQPTKICRANRHNIPHQIHVIAIRNNNSSLGYSSRILNIGHAYRTITDTRDIIRTEKRKTFKHVRKIPRVQNQ